MTEKVLHLKRWDCRACRARGLELVLSMGAMPPANAFRDPPRGDDPEQAFPLDLYRCRSCSLLQLSDVVNPELLFGGYAYRTGASRPLVEHFRKLAESFAVAAGPETRPLAVEIGSNDGTFLSALRDRGWRVLGVEPAREIAREAEERGIPTLPVFFSADTAEKIIKRDGLADLIFAANVFTHMDDPGGALEAVKRILKPEGVFLIEVSHAGDLIEGAEYDQIYHEHLSYFSLSSLKKLLERHGFEIFDARLFRLHGDMLRASAGLPSAHPISPQVRTTAASESPLDDRDAYRKFQSSVRAHKSELRDLLHRLAGEGRRIVGYGAPAKGNTLLNFLNLRPGVISYLIDTTPSKQGKLAPGTKLMVHPPEAAPGNPPDYYLLLAWNYTDYILEKETAFRADGGKFVIPFPDIRVV